MSDQHEHKWIPMSAREYICNVPGCGIRCDAAPSAELAAARARVSQLETRHGELYNMLSEYEGATDASAPVVLRRLLDELTKLRGLKGLPAESLTHLAARASEELGARPGIDIVFVYVAGRVGGCGVSSFATPGIAIEVLACQVMEGLVMARKMAHEQQQGQRG